MQVILIGAAIVLNKQARLKNIYVLSLKVINKIMFYVLLLNKKIIVLLRKVKKNTHIRKDYICGNQVITISSCFNSRYDFIHSS